MNEDEVLSRITRLLEQGCTMLAAHHDCGAPLFRCQGEVVCPVCSFAERADSQAEMQLPPLSEERLDVRSNPGRARMQEGESVADKPDDADLEPTYGSKQSEAELSKAIGSLRSALLARLRELTVSVQDEHDLHMLKRQLDCLEGLLRILRSLQG
ncbi:MAG: hypothetical protein A4E49_02656 [Methanosaeta sp. PtaU1.Bin112]|nr:MAG: hypothetical protein A4E49_02656 [Methanosaeta sp. PtaU1.Bin112]